MSRSLKKPPFIHYKLSKRVDDAHTSGKKTVIKTAPTKKTTAAKKTAPNKKPRDGSDRKMHA